MQYLKKIRVLALLITGVMSLLVLQVGSQETERDLTSMTEEISLEQFFEKFLAAVQVDDVNRIRQLIRDNPNTAQNVQQRLTLLGEGKEENAKQYLALAEILGKFVSETLLFEPFVEEFLNAARTNNFERIQQLVTDHPKFAKELHKRLVLGSEGPDEKAADFRALVQVLEIFLLNDLSRSDLDHLLEEGKQALSRADYSTALKIFQEGLEQARTLNDKLFISHFLISSGIVYYNWGQYPKSLEYFQQALTIRREIGNKQEIADALTNIGVVYQDLGQYQQALEYLQQALETHRDIGDKQKESADLANLSTVYQSLGQYQKALEYSQQALEIKRQIGDKQGIGNNLANIGVVYENLGQYQRALEYQQQALEIMRDLGNKYGEGAVLTNIGLIYRDLGEYPKALEYSQQALEVKRPIGDKRGVGNNLGNIGVVYQNLAQYEKALEYSQQSLKIMREIKDKRGEGAALTNIGLSHGGLSQYQQALKYLQQALKIKRRIGDKKGEGGDLTNIGRVYQNLGDYQKAQDYFRQALLIHRDIGDEQGESADLTAIGMTYQHVGQYQQALEYFRQALTINRDIGDKHGEGSDLASIGETYWELGQYQEALRYLQQALSIHRNIGSKDLEGGVLGTIGNVYLFLGQYQYALEYFQQALQIIRDIGNKSGEGTLLNNIGLVYRNLGQDRQGLEYFRQALTIAREVENKQGEEDALANSGNVYLKLKQTSKALEYYQQALEIAQTTGDKEGESASLNNIGIVYRSLGQYQQALEYYQQSLKIKRDSDNKRGIGISLINVGLMYRYLGQYPKALSTFQESIEIFEMLGTTEGLWRTHHGLASVKAHLDQLESAIEHYEQALDTIEQLREGLIEKEHKLSFMQDKIQVYDEFIEFLRDLHQEHPNKGYDRKALEIFERKQGRVFLEEMGQSGARLFAGLPEAITQKELDLELQLEQTRKQLSDERAKQITEQNKELIQNLEEREKTLVADQNALQEQIKTEYPDYYALKYPKPASLAELQEKILQPGELMLVYGVMEEKTMLWLISPSPPPSHQGRGTKPSLPGGDLRMYTLPVGEKELQEKITELRRIMEIEWKRSRGEVVSLEEDEHSQEAQRKVVRYGTPKDQGETKTFTQASHELYLLLIPEEVRSLLTEEHTLNIVPTGPLYALPFEALVTRESTPALSQADSGLTGKPTPAPPRRGRTPPYAPLKGGIHYLIEDIPISYLSSASLLKTLRESQARRQATAPYPLLAFAHPVYESPSPNPSHQGRRTALPTPDPSQEGKDTPLRPPQGGNVSLQALRSQAYYDFLRGYFKELPETAEEAKAIKTLLNAPDKSDPLQLREKASRANVFVFNTAKRLDDYQYLVFATHGVLPGEVDQITQPALVLSHPDDNGYLTMADVFQLQLNAKLVSLSACNTGSGEQVRGEGVMGLTRAFMYAGTPAIAVTLWSVETFSAKALDVGMFEHLKKGEPPADALRTIKLQMLRGNKGEDYTHPYYWAPFEVFGDGRLGNNAVIERG